MKEALILKSVIVLSNFFSVLGVRCFSCYDIIHPRFCDRIDTCYNDEVCGIDKIIKPHETTFNIGCVKASTCHSKRTVSDVEGCQTCCNTDLCNVDGCGEHGFGSNHGTTCLNCNGVTDSSECKNVMLCDDTEVCYIDEQKIAGETFYTMGCRNRHICQYTPDSGSIFGKRRTAISSRSLQCTGCCINNLCNDHCGNITSHTSTTPMKQIPTNPPKISTGNIGNEFFVAFLESFNMGGFMSLYVKIVATLNGVCLIQNPYQHKNKTINVTNTTLIHSFEIDMVDDATMYMSQDGIHRKALYIKCDIPVAVYGFSFTGYAVDGYLALPIQNLGKKYIVATFTVAVESRSGNGTSRFGIVGVAETTNVTVKLKMANGSINYQNSQYKNGDLMNFHLVPFETFFLSHNYDLSGTTIMSSHTIAVISGNSLIYRSNEGRSMEEMLLPCDQFGKSFIIPNLFGQKCKTRVFAQLQTHVFVQNQHLLQQYILSEGDFVEFEHFESVNINASNAVLVELYCNENTTYHGASMITVPGLLHYKSHYKFPVPYFQHKSQPRFYITILIRTDEKNGLKLDHQFNIKYLKEVHISVGGNVYSILSVEMPEYFHDNVRIHEAVHMNGIPFGLIVYGHNDEQSYGYPAGLSLRH